MTNRDDVALPAALPPSPRQGQLYLAMRSEQCQRIELTLERLLSEESVDMIVARATEPGDSLLYVGARKITLVALVRRARARDQMMPRQLAHLPLAQFIASRRDQI